jgi:helicase
MKMDRLIKYDLPPELIALWRERESTHLLPLQEAAVKKHDLFGGGNLLIQAPTSSGKTFIGEMAALHTALRGKQVVYLVPLKALAEEKYRDFQEKYADYGLKVIVCTRDHREFDADLENGNFSIAVVVYEKLSQLLVRRPERIAEIDLVVADELEILSDPERGAAAELLLTRVLLAGSRLIGLSAVIGGAEELATWMEASLVRYERRPVELRHGVLFEGMFRYRTYNDQGEGEERLIDADTDSPWETLTQNLCHFVEGGESCLVFVKAKHEARRGAELLAGRLDQPPASNALEKLRELEPTRCRNSLLETLQRGVAFHNADLSPEERTVVEDAYRAGEVLVMVSTSTLAVGMNLPAQNVFISADKWRFDPRLDMPWKTPILHTEYENMGGRAGRFGAGHEYGRALLIAMTPFDQETYWRRYVEGEKEPIQPQLAVGPLEDHVLRLVAARACRTPESLLTHLERTLTGCWIWAERYTRDEIAFRVRAAVNRCMEAEMMQRDKEGALEATALGQAAAAKGITMATALELRHWLGQSGDRSWAPLDLIFAAVTTSDGRMPQVMLTAREYDHANYPGILKRITRDLELQADVPLNRQRNCNLMPFFEEVRAIKIALFLNDWITGVPMEELEEDYHTMAGQVIAAADQVSWIIDATVAVGRATCAEDSLLDRVTEVGARVQHGLPEAALPLARADLPELDRATLRMLLRDNLYTAEALQGQPRAVLESYVPASAVASLQSWVGAMLKRTEGVAYAAETNEPYGNAAAPVLVVDERRPRELLLENVSVPVQEKQFQLMQVLARHAGECVPYERIYQHVWGDVAVEDNQMHFQKRKLLKAIKAVHPAHEKLVETVPKRGFMLNLRPDQVLIRDAVASSAA